MSEITTKALEAAVAAYEAAPMGRRHKMKAALKAAQVPPDVVEQMADALAPFFAAGETVIENTYGYPHDFPLSIVSPTGTVITTVHAGAFIAALGALAAFRANEGRT